MSINLYLREKIPFLIGNIFLFFIVAILMKLAKVEVIVMFFVFIIWFAPLTVYIISDLVKKKIYFDKLTNISDNLKDRYLLSTIIEEPEFIEGKILYEILNDANRDMNENVKKYRDMQIEYREYIETWIHEIKTPIASTKLIIENNENSVTNRINSEINKIEGFIEQALYYARSSEVSKDYIIKQFSLRKVVMGAIKRNTRDFISKKIALDIKEIDYNVYSDIKWVEFMINQLIINAIKYSKGGDGKVTISAEEKKNNIILSIIDNGVGIVEQDINRVFDKGFTGENGRIFGKSTGMGLYLCKNLCDKLGLGITITSKVNEWTKIELIFPKGNFLSFKES